MMKHFNDIRYINDISSEHVKDELFEQVDDFNESVELPEFVDGEEFNQFVNEGIGKEMLKNLLPKKILHSIKRAVHGDNYKIAMRVYKKIKNDKKRDVSHNEMIRIAAQVAGIKPREFAKVFDRTTRYESVGLDERYGIVYDKDYSTWAERDALNYGLKKGYKPVATCGTKNMGANYMVLFELNSFDKKETSKVRLKSGQKIYRYASPATVLGSVFPYVVANLERGLIYHLTQESSSGDTDEIKFETRGEKMIFTRVIRESNQNGQDYDTSMKIINKGKSLKEIRNGE